MSWTDERIEQLKKLWEDGQTASQIAEELGGVSRNAVIGKAHRLGLQSRPSPVKAAADSSKAGGAAPARKAPAPKVEAAPVEEVREVKPQVAKPAPTPAPAPVEAKPAPAPTPAVDLDFDLPSFNPEPEPASDFDIPDFNPEPAAAGGTAADADLASFAPPAPAAVAPSGAMPDASLSADMASQLLEPTTQAAVRGSMTRLNGLGLGNTGATIESLMRDMLRPMLKEWLDENLPAVVERMVEKEIARVSRGE